MSASVLEIIQWQAQPGVTDAAMVAAMQALLPDLQQLEGFISKTMYRNADLWCELYQWQSEADAQQSNVRMADQASLQALLALVQPDTISIQIMRQV
ncbi:hypothetical protein [Leeia sp.]|uniref:hypothetical protein n=1 Tax=Leeia sp. TaxID=2884678 RepID=UPI0035B066B9